MSSLVIFSSTRFEHFFKSLKSRTFDILKHVSRFPKPKITQKLKLQIPEAVSVWKESGECEKPDVT